MSSAYEKLKPAHRTFVDGVVAGEIPTHVVRRMRPHLKRPDNLASTWLRRQDVKAAIAEAQLIEARLTALEKLFSDQLATRSAGARLQ